MGSNDSTCFFLHVQSNAETRPYVILTCVANALFILPTVAGSTLIIATMWRNPNLDLPNHVHLFNLAVADLMTGMLVQPCYIVHKIAWLHGNWSVDCTARVIGEIVAWISAAVSCSTVSFISIDRMLALRLHLKYQFYITRERTIILTISVWASITAVSFSRFLTNSIRPMVIVGLVGTLSGIVMMFVAYSQIYKYVRHHQRSIKVALAPTASTTGDQNTRLSRIKSLKVKAIWKSAINLAYLQGLYAIAYIPFVGSLIAFLVHGQTVHVEIAYDVTRTIVFCISSLHPFFYCWKIFDVREEVLKTWRKMRKTADTNLETAELKRSASVIQNARSLKNHE